MEREPLFEACKAGDIELVRKLINEGADVNIRRESYFHANSPLGKVTITPLYLALSGNDDVIIDLINLLLKKGANIENVCEYSDSKTGVTIVSTALAEAIFISDTEIALLLMDNGADVNIKMNISAIDMAIIKGLEHVKELKILSALEYACKEEYSKHASEKNLKIVRALLEHGAEIPEDLECCTKEIENLVKQYKKNFNKSKKSLDFDLINAVCDKNIKQVLSLIEKGANIDAADAYGVSALMYACRHGFNDIAVVLMEKGANVNLDGEYTPLTIAKEKGNIKLEIKLWEFSKLRKKGKQCLEAVGAKPIPDTDDEYWFVEGNGVNKLGSIFYLDGDNIMELNINEIPVSEAGITYYPYIDAVLVWDKTHRAALTSAKGLIISGNFKPIYGSDGKPVTEYEWDIGVFDTYDTQKHNAMLVVLKDGKYTIAEALFKEGGINKPQIAGDNVYLQGKENSQVFNLETQETTIQKKLKI